MQAIRVVTRLENRYADHDGLNLSWEALEGILKHNGPLVDEDDRPIGRYVHEWLPFGLYDIPASADLMLASYASLEAQAAAIADDIAYNAHDIDDALRARLIDLPELVAVPLAGDIVREVLGRWPDIDRSRQAHEVQRRIITRAVEDVIATANAEILDVGPRSADDVRRAGRSLIHFSYATAVAEKGLKAFMFERVYRSEAVMGPVRRSEALVGALFDRYFAEGNLPGRWGDAVGTASGEAERARIIADFIAGMTDPYAEAEYLRLFDGKGPVG
jgi:dGTPase